MTHWAYYNEIDPHAAQWLRNLIKAGHIAPGVVDTRSIIDVRPYDLRDFTQCHFFAGVGVWSHALRRAGWGDDRRVWTGSCPCQPFSSAGRGLGLVDERHLWPFWYHLIDQCNPPVIFGEQVANSDAMPWLDLVQDDLEGMGCTVGAVPFPAASVGAPHIRDRLYFVAVSGRERQQGQRLRVLAGEPQQAGAEAGWRGEARELANGGGTRLEVRGLEPARQELEAAERGGNAGGLADAEQHAGRRQEQAADHRQPQGDRSADRAGGHCGAPLRGFWADADWLPCRDGKARPVEPGTFPLAHGVAGRVGRLRAYGNAIVAPQAVEWISVVMECLA